MGQPGQQVCRAVSSRFFHPLVGDENISLVRGSSLGDACDVVSVHYIQVLCVTGGANISPLFHAFAIL